jgi:hypothetical protein
MNPRYLIDPTPIAPGEPFTLVWTYQNRLTRIIRIAEFAGRRFPEHVEHTLDMVESEGCMVGAREFDGSVPVSEAWSVIEATHGPSVMHEDTP